MDSADRIEVEAGAALYRALVEGCPDAIVVADREGAIRFWNAGAEATFGHTAAEAIGQSLDIIIPEKLQERHWTGYESVMASGRPGTAATARVRPPPQRAPAVGRVVSALRDRGAVVGIAAFMRDVTAAWEEQQELRKRLAALEAG
jgi:PAS domain S-box-containing protein